MDWRVQSIEIDVDPIGPREPWGQLLHRKRMEAVQSAIDYAQRLLDEYAVAKGGLG